MCSLVSLGDFYLSTLVGTKFFLTVWVQAVGINLSLRFPEYMFPPLPFPPEKGEEKDEEEEKEEEDRF